MCILLNTERSNVEEELPKSHSVILTVLFFYLETKYYSHHSYPPRCNWYQLSITTPAPPHRGNTHKHSRTRFNPSSTEACASVAGILGLVSRGFYSRAVIQPLRSGEGGRGKKAERRTGKRPSGATGRGVTRRSHRQLGAQLQPGSAFSLTVFGDRSDAAELKCPGFLAYCLILACLSAPVSMHWRALRIRHFTVGCKNI